MNKIQQLTKEKQEQLKARIKSKLSNVAKKITGHAAPLPTAELEIDKKNEISKIICLESYELTQKIWYVSLITLPLDLLLNTLPTGWIQYLANLPAMLPLTCLALGLSILFTFKKSVVNLTKEIQNLPKSKFSIQTWVGIAAIMLLAIGLIMELVKSSSKNLLATSMQLFIYGAAIWSVLGKNKVSDPTAQFINKLKRDYFLIHSLPIIAARLLAPLVIIQILSVGSKYSTIGVASTTFFGLILILFYKSERSDFIKHCRRCGLFIPASLFSENLCKSCLLANSSSH